MKKSKAHLKKVSKVVAIKGKLTKRSFWVKDNQAPKPPKFPSAVTPDQQASGLQLKLYNWMMQKGTHPVRKAIAVVYNTTIRQVPIHHRATVGMNAGTWMDPTRVSSYRSKMPKIPGQNSYQTRTPFSRHNFYTRIATENQTIIADMYRGG